VLLHRTFVERDYHSERLTLCLHQSTKRAKLSGDYDDQEQRQSDANNNDDDDNDDDNDDDIYGDSDNEPNSVAVSRATAEKQRADAEGVSSLDEATPESLIENVGQDLGLDTQQDLYEEKEEDALLFYSSAADNRFVHIASCQQAIVSVFV
jgi:hypothetical protein